MGFAIETDDLRKELGGRPVIRGCSLQVPEGSVYGFIGPNGAGKTTVMRLLLRVLKADSGSIRMLGHDMNSDPRRALAKTGAFVESPALYEHLTARGNLDLTRRLLGLPESEIDRVLDVTGMARHAARKVRDYSLGMRQRVGLARALLGKPELLLLDEPTNGLDPEGISEMRELIRDLPDRIGATVFVSSHLLSEVEQVASHAGLLREGQLVMQGRMQSLLASERTLVVGTDKPKEAITLLTAAGHTVRFGGSHQLAITCSRGSEFADFAQRINTSLVESGIGVSELREESRSLEDLYKTAAGTGLKGEAA
ncbi:ATP-binding cassette domain-containing protein [Aurantiacibacter sp. D1-12]|uniref:ATP-binding cassette domain-containing protein n=1 Tax=Aurantiacibacter sp. D1-12 TaxID=2993658 RepID=UPI00237CCA5E|nr:ATP-binding cassette domain-containing protein [Aurantiacibacter sp. D1-12]MDE1467026.1 ATP-binding cassette domain-containing protein [Aurantiacibacter sp. D1-12]